METKNVKNTKEKNEAIEIANQENTTNQERVSHQENGVFKDNDLSLVMKPFEGMPVEIVTMVEEFHTFVNEGETIEGYAQGVSTFINKKTGEESKVAKLLTSYGIMKLFGNYMILKAFEGIELGTPVRIQYLGKRTFKDATGQTKNVSLYNIFKLK